MKDQIEKQAIEEMANDLIECHTEFVDGNGDIYTNYDETAEKMVAKGYRKQGWISVEERLPKQWESVLVCCGDEDEIGTDFIASNGRWYEHIHDTVTHWMPLPEPPKMKGGAE